MRKKLIIAFSILFVFVVVMLLIDMNIIELVRVKPAELYSDYITAKDIAKEIFTEELKNTEYTALDITPLIHIETDCPTNEFGFISYPHGHQWCKSYYRVSELAKASIRKDGELITIYCYIDDTKEKYEHKIFTDAYFNDIHSGFEEYLSEKITNIYPHKSVDIEYFYGYDSSLFSDMCYHRLFPYQITSFNALLADQTIEFEVIANVYLPDDIELDKEKCQELMDLIPYPQTHVVEFRLWRNGRYDVIERDGNTGEVIFEK